MRGRCTSRQLWNPAWLLSIAIFLCGCAQQNRQVITSFLGDFTIPVEGKWEHESSIRITDEGRVELYTNASDDEQFIDFTYVPNIGIDDAIHLSRGEILGIASWPSERESTSRVELQLGGAPTVVMVELVGEGTLWKRPRFFVQACRGVLILRYFPQRMRFVGYPDEFTPFVERVIRSFQVSSHDYCEEQDRTRPTPAFEPRPKVPSTVEEAFELLDAILDTNGKREEFIQQGPLAYHFGLGMWMRNNWGLWAGTSPLFRILRDDYCVRHVDGMSALILDQYWRRIQKKPLQLEVKRAECTAWIAAGSPGEAPHATIRVTTEPVPAIVWHYTSADDATPFEFETYHHGAEELWPWQENIRLEARGYKAKEVSIDPKPNELYDLHIVLEPEDAPPAP